LNKSKNSINILIGLIIMISTQATIRFIGIDNMSAQVMVACSTIICILFIAVQYKNRTKGFGVKYNMIVSTLMTLTLFSLSVVMTIIKCYPNLIDKYGKIVLIFSLVVFFALALFVVVYKIVYERKRK